MSSAVRSRRVSRRVISSQLPASSNVSINEVGEDLDSDSATCYTSSEIAQNDLAMDPKDRLDSTQRNRPLLPHASFSTSPLPTSGFELVFSPQTALFAPPFSQESSPSIHVLSPHQFSNGILHRVTLGCAIILCVLFYLFLFNALWLVYWSYFLLKIYQ